MQGYQGGTKWSIADEESSKSNRVLSGQPEKRRRRLNQLESAGSVGRVQGKWEKEARCFIESIGIDDKGYARYQT